MRLRKSITRPQKLQDEIAYGRDSKDPTKPAFPDLLQSQVIPFNPQLLPAAFPSLPFPTDSTGKGDSETTTKTAADAGYGSGGDHQMSDAEPFPTGFHPKTRRIPNSNYPIDSLFEDEMASSGDDGNVRGVGDRHKHSDVRDVDDGHFHPQVRSHVRRIDPSESLSRGALLTWATPQLITPNTVDWNDLCPAVQLAIISRMSETYSITKVYDLLGLYAHELKDIRKLAVQYNYQREMEDYLTFWMQQDQLRGILRTDHTLTLRGAPEAYQEFQTRSYMRKIQAEIDENLLQATCAEVNLGKRFLGQQGIHRDMVGFWGYLSGYQYPARPRDPQILPSALSVPIRGGLDSGYASAIITPNKLPTRQEKDNAPASGRQIDIQTQQLSEPTGSSRRRNTKKLGIQKAAVSVKEKQQAQQRSSPRSHNNTPSPGDDASAAGSSGRSRRSVRRTPKYDEAMSELKLRGSGDERDVEYETPNEDDQNSGRSEPRVLLPRLLITSDNRIIGVPAPSSASITSAESSAGTMQMSSSTPQLPSTGILRAPSTTPERTASPLPLQRVVIRPPKITPKPKQTNPFPISLDGPLLSKFSQKLLETPRERNDFTKSLLKASERGTVKATPWIPVQPEHFSEPTPPPLSDHQRRSDTLMAPAFSPITERFQKWSYHKYQGSTSAVPSSVESADLQRVDLTKDETVMKNSLLVTPDSTLTPATEAPYLWRNDRSIVTESSSPVLNQRELTPYAYSPDGDGAMGSRQHSATNDHGETTATLDRVITPRQPALALGKICRRLDPVTGNVIIDPPMPQDSNPASSPDKKAPHASSSQNSRPLTALREAGEEVKKAAAELKYVALEFNKTMPRATKARPLAAGADQRPQKGGDRTSTAPATQSSQEGPKGKRKYAKSEAQRQKEALRAERREREQKLRDPRLALKATEAEAKRAERGAGDAEAAK